MARGTLRQAFLWSAIIFLALTAAIAIGVVLFGEFGDLQARVLGSSGTVSAACVLALACAAFRERHELPGTLGIVLAGAAALAMLVLIWGEVRERWLGKSVGVLAIWAVAVAHAELLLLPRLAERHRWVQRAVVAAIAVLAALLTIVVVGEVDSEAMGRTAGAVAIVVALLTVVVPILWKVAAGENAGGARPAVGPRLLLEQRADGTWVDAAGARYTVTRIEG